jgi:spoIIIJ-associated protein
MEMKFSAKTLEQAYELASKALECSILDLEVTVVQKPNSGFFGLFCKDAIIIAYSSKKQSHNTSSKETQSYKTKTLDIKDIDSNNLQFDETKEEEISSAPEFKQTEHSADSFYKQSKQQTDHMILIKENEQKIVDEIKENIDSMFSYTSFNLDGVEVSMYDNKTVLVEFKGEDAPLMIGKEGYRYKALSYILFNWIHDKYGLMVRLEIAQFLKTQEQSIANYLVGVCEDIDTKGYSKTKPLDGVLVHIALEQLRDKYPQKYVAIKTNIRGDKYILVNEYKD